jgi:hypothetical protein
VLVTGTGKPRALAEIAQRRHQAVDADDPGWNIECQTPDGLEPLWDLEAVGALLDRTRCLALHRRLRAHNHRFDAVFFLSAPVEVLLEQRHRPCQPVWVHVGGSGEDRERSGCLGAAPARRRRLPDRDYSADPRGRLSTRASGEDRSWSDPVAVLRGETVRCHPTAPCRATSGARCVSGHEDGSGAGRNVPGRAWLLYGSSSSPGVDSTVTGGLRLRCGACPLVARRLSSFGRYWSPVSQPVGPWLDVGRSRWLGSSRGCGR